MCCATLSHNFRPVQATSALDNASEHVVQQALDRLAKVSVMLLMPLQCPEA